MIAMAGVSGNVGGAVIEEGTVGLLDDHLERAEDAITPDNKRTPQKSSLPKKKSFADEASTRRAERDSHWETHSSRSSKRSSMLKPITVHQRKACSCLFAMWIYVPIIVFALAGVLGGISFFIYIASDESYDVVLTLTLLGVGLFASIQVWLMGALADQIRFLQRLRRVLHNQVEHLDGKVSGVEAENAEFSENVDNLNDQQEKLESLAKDQRENVEVLRETQSMLEDQNSSLKKEIEAYNEMTGKLQETTDKMTENLTNLDADIKKFDELRTQIAAQFGEDTAISTMLEKSMSTWNRMNSMFDESEYIILRQIQADVETAHLRRNKGSEGIPAREFRRFVSRLPPKFKNIWNNNVEFAFQKFDADGDGTMSPQEFDSIIRRLVKAAEPTQ